MKLTPTQLRRVAALSLAAAMAITSVSTASAAPRKSLTGSKPGWTKDATYAGKVSGRTKVEFRVYLDWAKGSAAEAYALAVSTPGNAAYRQFLTPAEFRSRFAPAASDVAKVSKWLRSNGLKVTYTPDNNHYVQVEGTVSAANAAFGTTMVAYKYQGKRMIAPKRALTVPAGLPSIAGVVGLDDTSELVQSYRRTVDAPPAPGFRNGDPTSAYWAEKSLSTTSYAPHGDALPNAVDYPYVVKGYTPSQLRSAYGFDNLAGIDGRGVTVAIIDAYASPTIREDADEYSRRRGEPTFTPGQFTEVVPPGIYKRAQNKSHDPQGWWGEETLDVEAVHAIAPAANIVYVGSPNNRRDLDAAMNHVVDKHLATIVTNSYGYAYELLPRGYVKPLNDTFIQAVIQGIGIYFSSGDDGDLSQQTGGVQFPAWPASSPWVTAVGGTSLAVGADGARIFETGWQTAKSTLAAGPAWSEPAYLYGSGGGTSYLFPQPAWQSGVVPDSMSQMNGPTRMRVIPDVSMLGDPSTGFLVGQTQAFADGVYYDESRTGGTSLSSPLMAGVMALAEQVNGSPIGFANPLFYSGTAGFRDVTSVTSALTAAGRTSVDGAVVRSEFTNYEDATDGYTYSLRYLGWDAPLTIHTVDGYDNVTGIGTPNGTSFLRLFGYCDLPAAKVKGKVVAAVC